MGYYTRFDLSVTGQEEFMDEFERYAESGATFGQYGLAVEQWARGRPRPNEVV